ncbi:MAG: lactamase [Candidatus Doudnabacteria bacterium CG10_big_fil_rev_8_21_14_0_10_41_10]|uniref:Lactamase n=1 Tax=Candidatus Doudnabacteria bacterium CG10_big_fil_rev_8_21_14_0_10_41_10 TaxID=1974551 RepID=A0A2H0VDU5_9BACT|nr:MAG: lactamase [Candidatus Doudnabacteria bacterium CG10_big_fil_rev_8_21_14_0_10_41_10]
MHIYWFGLSSFKIVSKDVTVFTDPFGKSSGLTSPRGAGDIVISSNPDNDLHNNFSSISGNPFVIDNPGEYDIKGVFVHGIPADNSKKIEGKKPEVDRRSIFSITLEGINLAFLGSFSENTLSETQLEELGQPDIVILPVGGKDVLNAHQAMKVANQLEPFVIIPMHYKTPGLKIKLDSLDSFLKEIGDKSEEMDKLLIKKTDFEEEKTKIVALKPQRT